MSAHLSGYGCSSYLTKKQNTLKSPDFQRSSPDAWLHPSAQHTFIDDDTVEDEGEEAEEEAAAAREEQRAARGRPGVRELLGEYGISLFLLGEYGRWY